MNRSSVRMALDVSITVPLVPNFVDVNVLSTPISHLTDEQLRVVADRWSKDLIANARRMREIEQNEQRAKERT